MVATVDNSYHRISSSNNADLDHPAIQTTNSAWTRVVLSISTCLSVRNSRSFPCFLVDDDLVVARDSLVLEDAVGPASPAIVCGNMDGPSKPLRMDIQATREYRLFVSTGNEFRRR